MIPYSDGIPARRFPVVNVALIAVNFAVWLFYELPNPDAAINRASFYPCDVDNACHIGIPWGVGWITAMFYAAYMVSVPVLVTLTDRVDAKRIYLFGVGCSVLGHLLFGLLADGFWSAMATRALTGMGWAGTYMTGLKLLADQVDAKQMSRATAGHAASTGISGALSFACADLLASLGGWKMAFFCAISERKLFTTHTAPSR